MSRTRRSAVQRYHDRVAPRYDDSYDDDFWKWHDELTWAYLKPFLPADLRGAVLDLGCGTGKWGAKLAKTGYAVTSVDISNRMLDRARMNVESEAGTVKSEFVQADLCDLSALPKQHFAMAVAMGDPIGCVRSPAAAMKQIRRVLTDEGVLVATFDNRLAALEFYLQDGDARAMGRFLRDGRTHWFTNDPEEQFPIVTFTPDGVRDLVESSGFEVLEMVGKTVLPMRHHRHLLSASRDRRTWAAIERKLSRNPHAMGRASHIQVACRVQPKSEGKGRSRH